MLLDVLHCEFMFGSMGFIMCLYKISAIQVCLYDVFGVFDTLVIGFIR